MCAFYDTAPLAVRTPTSAASLFFGRKTKNGSFSRTAKLEPVTPSVRNMVALLAWGASHCSLFLPAQRPPFLALANIVGLLAWSASQSSVFAHSHLSLFPPPAAGGREPVNSRGTRLNAVTQEQTTLKAKQKTTLTGGLLFGASNRTRTCDTAVNSRVLYRLSY